MKVLIVDKLSPETVTELEKLGCKVEVRSDLNADNLPMAVADVGVLVVRSTKVTAKTIDARPRNSRSLSALAPESIPSTWPPPARRVSTWRTVPARTPWPWPSWPSE
jgi:hypothetical protein